MGAWSEGGGVVGSGCQSLRCADVQPPGSGSEIGDSGGTADVRLLPRVPQSEL